MDEKVAAKISAQVEFNVMVKNLITTFGQTEATKMLRAAAKMIAPAKEGK